MKKGQTTPMLRIYQTKSVIVTIGDDSFTAKGFSMEEIDDLFGRWLAARDQPQADPNLNALADQLDSQQHDLTRAVNAAKET